MKLTKARVSFELRDMWLGVYWNKGAYPILTSSAVYAEPFLDVYVCLLPCVPVHLHFDSGNIVVVSRQ